MENQTTQEAPQAQPELSVNDLKNIRVILDTAVRRGAFGAAEMTSIGSVFDRLNAFLTAVAPESAPASEEPTQQA